MTKNNALILFATVAALSSGACAPGAVAEETTTFEAGGMAALTNSTASGTRLQAADFSAGRYHESSTSLGGGFSITAYSDVSDPLGASWLRAPNSFLTDLHGNLMSQTGAYFGYAYETVPADYGARVSMDLGSGVSFNVIGGVSRMMNVGSVASPGLGFSTAPQFGTSAHVGGGFSMDLGGGSSLSFTGGVSTSSVSEGRCLGVPVSLCR